MALNDEEFWRKTFALLNRGDSVSGVADKLRTRAPVCLKVPA